MDYKKAEKLRQEIVEKRNKKILEMYACGKSVAEIAKTIGVTRQGAYYLLNQLRDK